MSPPLQKFCRTLIERDILAADEVKSQYRAWRAAEPKNGDDPQAFAKYLVGAGKVRPQQLRELSAAPVPVAKAAPPAGDCDVELIPIRPVSFANLDRRDLLMLLSGAAGTLGAILFATILAKMLQPKS